jgi:hypothetical protein
VVAAVRPDGADDCVLGNADVRNFVKLKKTFISLVTLSGQGERFKESFNVVAVVGRLLKNFRDS